MLFYAFQFLVTSISADELKNSKRTPWKTPEDKRGKFDTSSPEALLQCILGSTNVATFFSDFWEKEPLHVVREDEKFCGDCFNLEVVKHVVGCNDMKFLLDVNAFTLTDGNKQEFVQEQGSSYYLVCLKYPFPMIFVPIGRISSLNFLPCHNSLLNHHPP